jgi:hypothetical protein
MGSELCVLQKCFDLPSDYFQQLPNDLRLDVSKPSLLKNLIFFILGNVFLCGEFWFSLVE